MKIRSSTSDFTVKSEVLLLFFIDFISLRLPCKEKNKASIKEKQIFLHIYILLIYCIYV